MQGSGKQLPRRQRYPARERLLRHGQHRLAQGGDSQMFILTKDDPRLTDFLQGKYTAFGFVCKGVVVVLKLAANDKITSMARSKT